MLAHLSIGSALVLSSLASLVPTPAAEESEALITPGPQIELLKKQNDLQYIGWVQFSSIWSTEKCDPGNTYYQAGGQWACCTTTRAGCLNMPINCVNGNMIYRATATGSTSLTNTLITRACTQIWTAASDASFSICNTAFMYENDRDSSPKANIICGVSSLNWSYYRNQPSSATVIGGSSSVRSVNPLTTPVVSSTPVSSPTPITTPTVNPDPPSESKAWIAGAVVGPIVGLALIGFGAFFFMRRKKNKSQNQNVAPATGSIPPAGASAYQQNSYNPASSQPPQYYPPMQQNAGAAPMGVAKQDNYYNAGPQSPTTQGSQSPYGAPQQWQQPGGQQVFNAPSPSMSPQPQNVQPAPYVVSEARPFSSELPAETVSVQPKK
ncbi:hypothetical protein GQ44DRAFT_763285 [Phaeosphaeriaceae sp. PMI808]|nr:hypothetical protein GQ44DRAFT_763285 [Phaeosphaeriaceae sp. PMI808]